MQVSCIVTVWRGVLTNVRTFANREYAFEQYKLAKSHAGQDEDISFVNAEVEE